MKEADRRSKATLGFNLPLGFGRLGAAEDQARASLAQARAQREAKATELTGRIEIARADYEESLHGMEVIEQILIPTSERALTAARAGYESGRGTFSALMDAARRRADAHLALEEARTRAARGWAELQRAVAGDVISFRTLDPGAGSGAAEPAPSESSRSGRPR